MDFGNIEYRGEHFSSAEVIDRTVDILRTPTGDLDTDAFQNFLAISKISELRAQLHAFKCSSSPRLMAAEGVKDTVSRDDILKALDAFATFYERPPFDYRALPELAALIRKAREELGDNFAPNDPCVEQLIDFLDQAKKRIRSAWTGEGQGGGQGNFISAEDHMAIIEIRRKLEHGKADEALVEKIKSLSPNARWYLCSMDVEQQLQEHYGKHSVAEPAMLAAIGIMGTAIVFGAGLAAAAVAAPLAAVAFTVIAVLGASSALQHVREATENHAAKDAVREAITHLFGPISMVELTRRSQPDRDSPSMGGGRGSGR